jgi:hypothetical protein
MEVFERHARAMVLLAARYILDSLFTMRIPLALETMHP